MRFSVWTVALGLLACESDGSRDAVLGPDAVLPDATPDVSLSNDVAPAPPDASPDAAPPPPLCNGHAEYCDRPFNQVAQACTHNAMSSKAYRFIIPTPNQVRSLTEQLDEGVRCLMLDTYFYRDELYLCHGECGAWGAMRLSLALDEIRTWMAAHPRDTVTFILEAYITEEQTLSALASAGLAAPDGSPSPDFPLFHAGGPPGTPWPTLGEMIDENRRLVMFTDDSAANGTWHLHWPTFGWETPYNDPTFTCAHGRGEPTAYDHQVFILNHYSLGPAGGNEPISTMNNTFDSLTEHGRRCEQVSAVDNPWGQRPTFVNVDHFQVPVEGGPTQRPDVFDAVDALNGIVSPE